MLIVYWPITIKFRTREQTSKPQTNYRCCLQFCYHAPYWLISRNTITFHKYFCCSRLCEFHSKNPLTIIHLYIFSCHMFFEAQPSLPSYCTCTLVTEVFLESFLCKRESELWSIDSESQGGERKTSCYLGLESHFRADLLQSLKLSFNCCKNSAHYRRQLLIGSLVEREGDGM